MKWSSFGTVFLLGITLSPAQISNPGVQPTGNIVAGHCPQFADSSGYKLSDTGAACGSGGGGVNNTLSFGAVNIAITNPLYPKAYVMNAAAGNVDLYTVPTGRLALAVDMIVTNPTGNSEAVTVLAEVKTGGVYHTFDFVANQIAVGSAGRSVSMAPFLLHAGESLSINTSAAGVTVWASVIEFDATANINDARLFSLSVGNNTIFTVPAGKTVQFIGFPAALSLIQSGWVWYWNNTGATRTVSLNVVPSGQSPAANNTIFAAAGISSQQMVQQQFYGSLAPGDFVSVNTDSAASAQMAWVIYTQQ